jgi:uncharacterized protein YgbK (DUF1537 family)
VLIRIQRLDGTTQVGRVTPDAPDFVVTAAASSSEVALTYLKLGVEHILLGIDHLLFVLALLILVQGTHKLIVTITAFTVAHSITLAGASLGFLSVPGAPVEACCTVSVLPARCTKSGCRRRTFRLHCCSSTSVWKWAS